MMLHSTHREMHEIIIKYMIVVQTISFEGKTKSTAEKESLEREIWYNLEKEKQTNNEKM